MYQWTLYDDGDCKMGVAPITGGMSVWVSGEFDPRDKIHMDMFVYLNTYKVYYDLVWRFMFIVEGFPSEHAIDEAHKWMKTTYIELDSFLANNPTLRNDILAGYKSLIKNVETIQSTPPPQNKKRKKARGYVYILKSEQGYKIGRTKDPKSRYKTFGVKLPFKVAYELVIKTDNYIDLEKWLHKVYDHRHINGEWFALTAQDVEEIRESYEEDLIDITHTD